MRFPGSVLVVVAGLVAHPLPSRADQGSAANLLPASAFAADLQKVLAQISRGAWSEARASATKLTEKILTGAAEEAETGRLLARVFALRASAEEGLGNEVDARWLWQSGQERPAADLPSRPRRSALAGRLRGLRRRGRARP